MKGKEELGKVLMKVAQGCLVQEVTEEYAEVDGQMRLTKRKEVRRDIPPDLKAVQMLLGESKTGWDELSDEELEEEKKRLLKALKSAEKKEGKGERRKKGTGIASDRTCKKATGGGD